MATFAPINGIWSQDLYPKYDRLHGFDMIQDIGQRTPTNRGRPTGDNLASPKLADGIATYEVWDDKSNDCVLLRFVDDALIEIDFIYFLHRVASHGGMAAMMSRSIEKFGPPWVL